MLVYTTANLRYSYGKSISYLQMWKAKFCELSDRQLRTHWLEATALFRFEFALGFLSRSQRAHASESIAAQAYAKQLECESAAELLTSFL
ncbi:MAG: hypothetical protein KatS3mg111_3458 [Pirellulaceae bacterium]|nr:MAG: hypothetical protein KatS3mg111_3458 [Pirellulaceae bacterium]